MIHRISVIGCVNMVVDSEAGFGHDSEEAIRNVIARNPLAVRLEPVALTRGCLIVRASVIGYVPEEVSVDVEWEVAA